MFGSECRAQEALSEPGGEALSRWAALLSGCLATTDGSLSPDHARHVVTSACVCVCVCTAVALALLQARMVQGTVASGACCGGLVGMVFVASMLCLWTSWDVYKQYDYIDYVITWCSTIKDKRTY